MEDVIIKIKGMMCEHCEKMIHDAAVGVKGVRKAKADLKKAR
ncbi:heavy-metal-associated domain-containing protein [Candidatus Methanoperedens nitratireducens]|uniref:Copper chaperone CopZ n=1 Tax=Candidatus Methanoperedens nitratireducens TaxID=1392998 RepID=A0A284VMT7_9EURY